jgi:predicted nucleic acid-binding Zn ribbon protein
MDDAQLQTVWQQRQFSDRVVPLSQPLAMLMKHTLAKRVRQVGKLAEVWDEVIPEEIQEHTALESLSRGVLTVRVDSSAHRYQLRMLLSGGLLEEIRSRFGGALSKVRLIPGQFQAINVS